MPPHDSYDAIGAMLHVHKVICGFILQTTENIPESRMTEQPGGLVNHPAWTLSHLNAYAEVLLAMLDAPTAPAADDEMERFGYGTTPVPDPAAYQPKHALLQHFKVRNERLAAVVAEKHAAYFARPAPERFQP